ncbi:MAG TPA: oxidoreductase [Bacteroidales bacterium]|nr:oxidoreductase [Bacteroidales bacterium]
MRLQGNKIVITGATSGIGEALAKKFVELDNQVIAIGRNSEKLKSLNVHDNRIIPFCCDIAKFEDLDRLAIFIENEHSDTNILINNAGIQFNYHFAEEHHLLSKIEQEINTNFIAPLKLISILLPTLKVNDNAAIVNVTSGLGLVPKKQAPVYCGTKAGLHIFTKSLRYQLQHIKVFELISPLVDTPMTAGRGKGKISPEKLVKEFISAFKKDKFEVNIGKVKLLKLINRISPTLAESIMKNIAEK